MSEPTVTQTVRTMMERKGALVVFLALTRHYWKTVTTVAGALLAFGIFLDQFHALQASNDKQATRFEAFASTVDLRLGAIEKQQAVEIANWSTITTEAKIVISPKTQVNAPAEVRKGKIHR